MVRSNQRGHSDNIYCHNLTAWRRDIGEYFGGLIQGNCAIFSFLSSGGLFIAIISLSGHAWWHILTGLGASKIATGIICEFPGLNILCEGV